MKLAAGEKTEIAFTGNIPEVSDTTVNVTVYYAMDTVTPIGYRTQAFRLMNGEKAQEGEGYESIAPITPFDSITNAYIDAILSKLGLRELISMLYSIAYYWCSAII